MPKPDGPADTGTLAVYTKVSKASIILYGNSTGNGRANLIGLFDPQKLLEIIGRQQSMLTGENYGGVAFLIQGESKLIRPVNPPKRAVSRELQTTTKIAIF